jgi:AraC-like DNA-binding protein
MNKPTISTQIFRHVANCLRLTGHDAETDLAMLGMNEADIHDPKGVIPLEQFLTFLEQAAEQSGNPNFGLFAGRLGASDSLGPLGFLFLSAPTLRAAFTNFNAYLTTLQEATRNRFLEEDGLGIFEYGITDQSLELRAQDAEFSIAVMHNFCRNYVGADFALTEVRFEHSCLSSLKIYNDFFGCSVFFDQEVNAFAFDEEFLERSGGAIDPALFPILEEHVRRKAIQAIGHAPITERARKILESCILAETPTLEQTAIALGVSVPTLNRHLRHAGYSWRNMVQEHRMNAATRLLKNSKRDIADIALSVGFAESASFVRSFKRHFGTTPGKFRSE